MRSLPDIPNGDQLGPYTIGAELGRGGIAIVYEAVDSRIPDQGPLAVKVAYRTNEQRDKRFIREFERLRVIALPGVARVYEAGMTDELIWYAMDQISGKPMNRAISGAGEMSDKIQVAIDAGIRMFEVLAGIHRLGFIHRDIKPSNVLVGESNMAHILDFGLVRLQERGDTLTRAGRLVGTVAFMSPEQTTGLPLTPRTDVFSAGLVIYEGLLGPRPRPHRQEEWLGRMCLQQVTPMSIRDPAIPRDLSTAVEKFLHLDPHARPSAVEAAEMLRNIRAGRLRSDWPSPPQFIGRDMELDLCSEAFSASTPKFMIIHGDVGTGRRRLLDQVQRRALLYGTPRITGICRPYIVGGAVHQLLQELFRTHADPEWRAKTAGPDVGTLLSMWPTLPLPSPPPSEHIPTISEVAQAAANTIHRGVESQGLMVVFERLDAVDTLTARAIQMLMSDPPKRIAIFGLMEPRWASTRAQKLVDHMVFSDQATRIELPHLTSPQASELAASLNDDSPMDPIDGDTPQVARDLGLERLAARRGETHPTLPFQLSVLGLAIQPLTEPVLKLLNIDPKPLVEQGVLRIIGTQGFALADNCLRQRAQSLIGNRAEAEDALADALNRGGSGSIRWANIARHMMHGHNPSRALAPAIRAAVYAVQTGQYNSARSWLMAIDPMHRDRNDPTYRALRFELAWCRARTSLSTDLSRIREDLVVQARDRASRPKEVQRCDLIEADLLVRQGRMEEAVARLEGQASIKTEKGSTDHGWYHLKGARILLDQGLPERARSLLAPTSVLGSIPERALVGIDLATLEGRVSTAIEGSRQAIARATGPDQGPLRATLLLRLGGALLEQGDRVGATQAIHRGRDELVTHGDRARLAEAHLLESRLALGRGQPTAARVLVGPIIATARAFSLGRLMALGWSMKLRLAAVMNDKVAARAAISGRNPNRQTGIPEWRFALTRWHRVQKNIGQAMEHADWDKPTTPAGVFLSIEAARIHLAMGNHNAAREAIARTQQVLNNRAYGELELLAQLVSGAIDPTTDEQWHQIVHQAKSSPWIELSLTSHAMDAHRSMSMGDSARARSHFKDLFQRANHIGHAYHTAVANEGLLKL